MDSQPQAIYSTPQSHARQFAHLLGIREDNPQAYSRETQQDMLAEAISFSDQISETARAQFCAMYLPMLVKALHQASKDKTDTVTCALLASALRGLTSQPLFHGHFLRSSAEANQLLETLVRILLRLGPKMSHETSASSVSLAMCRTHITLLDIVIYHALRHGSACKVNLVLPSDLDAKLLSHCRTQLAAFNSFQITRASDQENLMRVSQSLEALPTVLGVSGTHEIILTRRVKTNATSPGYLRCELSTVPEDEWEPDGTDECSLLAGKQSELMFCSKCRSVAYCSPEHQRADWKKHKPVCFKPSW